MYSTMDAHDIGCGPGGGRNTELVFKVVDQIFWLFMHEFM